MVQNVRKAVVEAINCGTIQCGSRVRNGAFFLTITHKLQFDRAVGKVTFSGSEIVPSQMESIE